MRVRLLAFATAAEAIGTRESELELPAGSRVGDLWELLERRHPDLAGLAGRLAMAVDGRLAGRDTPLADGAEVALLPPVSGGAPAAALVDGPIDVEALRRQVAAPGCGAVLTFLGAVRDAHRGRPVSQLDYDAYRPMALERLERIAAELEGESPGLRVAIVHRLGTVPVGEPSVAIAVASPHRAAAYEASRAALERLKREVPIWKRELYADGGAAWREEEPLCAEPASESG